VESDLSFEPELTPAPASESLMGSDLDKDKHADADEPPQQCGADISNGPRPFLVPVVVALFVLIGVVIIAYVSLSGAKERDRQAIKATETHEAELTLMASSASPLASVKVTPKPTVASLQTNTRIPEAMPTGTHTISPTTSSTSTLSVTITPTPSETTIPLATTTLIPIVVSPTPTAQPQVVGGGSIHFADPNDPTKLASHWSWHPGGSRASAYALKEDGTLRLIVGPGTDQWENNDSAPYISYKVSGDFEAEVKLRMVASSDWEVGGIGIMSTQDPKTWIRIVFALDNKVYFNRNGRHIAIDPYPSKDIYLRIVRQGTLISSYYSATAENWQPLKEDYVFSLPEEVRVYLLGFTQHEEGDILEFQDLKISFR
jgi:regulation of enolase protein 1 (concanavalin A-like superfamily)